MVASHLLDPLAFSLSINSWPVARSDLLRDDLVEVNLREESMSFDIFRAVT